MTYPAIGQTVTFHQTPNPADDLPAVVTDVRNMPVPGTVSLDVGPGMFFVPEAGPGSGPGTYTFEAAPASEVKVGDDVLYLLARPQHEPPDVVERPAKVVEVWSQTCLQLVVFTDAPNDGRDTPPVVHRSSVSRGTLPGEWKPRS